VAVVGLAIVVILLGGCGRGHAPADSSASAALSSDNVATAAAEADPSTWRPFQGQGFSISAPPDYAVDPNHDYKAMGPGTGIHGVAFAVPASLATGTNLGADSYIAVETLATPALCVPAQFLSDANPAPSVEQAGRVLKAATSNEGAAGNVYDQTVYTIANGATCIGVRYFVHSTEIGAYPAGTIKPFDRVALTARFDEIRQTLSLF